MPEDHPQKRIGYTTGVFDLLHVGHLYLLQKAKMHCKYLIVGVSSDALVLKLKGRKPVLDYEERAFMISSIRWVDEVVMEDDPNKVLAWERLRFNIIFKGSDWQGTPTWNAYQYEFNKVGVDIKFFQYTDNVSTTLIRKSLDMEVRE